MHSTVHQQTAPQRCAPAMLLEHCNTLVSSGLLRTSVGNPYYVRSARGRRPMLIAVPGAAPVERSAEQPSTTTEDARALHETRGASMTFPSKLLSRSVYSENGGRAQRKLWTNKALKH